MRCLVTAGVQPWHDGDPKSNLCDSVTGSLASTMLVALFASAALAARSNVTVYHINQLDFPGAPINMDIADLAGDVFFDILTIASSFACANPSGGGLAQYLVCANQETSGDDIGVTKLILDMSQTYGPYAQCNVCSHGSSPLNRTHECEAGTYVCDCHNSQQRGIPCGQNVGREEITGLGRGVGFLCLFSSGASKTTGCSMASAAQKLGGTWYSTLDVGHPSTWRVLAVAKRVRRSCHANVFFSAVERQNHACFANCADSGPPPRRNTSSLCWSGCFIDAALGRRARTSTAPATSGMSREALLAAWSQPFESSDPARGGCPNVPCESWTHYAAKHAYCDAPGAGTPYATDLAAVFGPNCNSARGFPHECCFAPLCALAASDRRASKAFEAAQLE